jgi:predicted GTPase
MARYKGFLNTALDGIDTIDNLQDGDCILIAEGCTHHRQCNDIGTVKIPRWLREHSSAEFFFNTVSGREFPEDITPYRVVIHCGGCMLTEREVQSRMEKAVSQGIPFLNYGVLIAHINGILARSIAPLPR